MATNTKPGKATGVQIEINLERDSKTKMWQGKGYAAWKGKNCEYYDSIGKTGECCTRVEAAKALHKLVGKWIAENA